MGLLKCSLAAAVCLVLFSSAFADTKTALLILAKAADPTNGLGWMESGSACAFKGVGCNNGNVTSIDISMQAPPLTGTLPPDVWASFPDMNYFTAKGNQLTGPIPSFAGADLLRSIELQNNAFTGTVPAALATLPALVYINLGNNPGVCGTVKTDKIGVDASAQAPCTGTPAAVVSPAAANNTPVASPALDLSPAASPMLVASPVSSPLPSSSPAALPSPAAVTSPAPPATYAFPECICAVGLTSTACKHAMITYCADTSANAAACTQYTEAAAGTNLGSAAAYYTFLKGRCFSTFAPPKDSYCSCGTDPASLACSQATVQLCAAQDALCTDLINASLGQTAAVVNVASWLTNNCAAGTQPQVQGAQLVMVLVLNNVTAQQFPVAFPDALKNVLADIVGGSADNVTVERILSLSGSVSGRRLRQVAQAVQVTSFIAGDPKALVSSLTTSFGTGDFTQRMQAKGINAQPVQNTVSVTAYNAPAPAPPAKKSKSSSSLPMIIGIAVGAALLVCILAVLVCVCLKRRRTRREQQDLPMSKTWLEPNTEDLKPTPSAAVSNSSTPTMYTVPPKPTPGYTGAYDATPVPLNVRTTDPSEVVVASPNSPKASNTTARNRFWRQGSATSDAPPAIAPLAPTSSLTSQPSRFASLPATGSAHSAAAAAVAAEASAAGGSATNKQAQQAERRKFWQQFELSWQANKSKPPAVAAGNPKAHVEDDEDIPSSGTSWTSDHTTTPTQRGPTRSTYVNPFVNAKK